MDWWRYNAAQKLVGGTWYSTLSVGQCDGNAATGPCSWQMTAGQQVTSTTALVRCDIQASEYASLISVRYVRYPQVKRVEKKCADDSVFSYVEGKAAAQAQTEGTTNCFNSCVGSRRKPTDPCWVKCFFHTALGPGSERGEVRTKRSGTELNG